MKAVLVLSLALLCVALVMSSTCSIRDIEPQFEENWITNNSQLGAATHGNSFATSDDTQSDTSQSSVSSANQSAGNSRSTNETVSSGSCAETPSNNNTTEVPSDGAASANVSPPDGRVYLGGEAPYAYTPTFSPKQEGLPIAPLTPDE